jgi:predicted DCC family thiol-disulfide oxidoreductase YuxK
MNQGEHIVLFDGYCVLCNGLADFLIKRNKKGIFKLGAIQSESGEKIINSLDESIKEVDSILYIHKGKAYSKSEAVLKMFSLLPGWKWTVVLKILPKKLRDWIYDVVGRNRYSWFGKDNSCRLPTPEERDHFI